MDPLINRRQLLRGSGALLLAAGVDGLAIEPRWLDVTSHELPIASLPRELEGFTLAQITDAHLTSLSRVESAVLQRLQSTDAQLVVLTGDMIDCERHLVDLKHFCDALRKPGRRLVATLGNWEYWGKVPLDLLRRAYEDVGVNLLVNESLVLPEGLSVSATDDFTAGSPDLHHVEPNRAAHASILLTHSPQLLDSIPELEHSFQLTLAGHTHGGQVRLSQHFAPVRPPGSGRFVSGWYDTRAGRAYVSRGTGTSIVAARFSCRPELPLFTFRQA
ncbi:MAG TPA: metallophosphoesterase [Polyangiaceae bacterium]|nr:metallophosphoesterase [Polyangiaceae bacterium]